MLDHPNLVRLYEVNEDAEAPKLGGTGECVVSTHWTWNINEMKQVMLALNAHEDGRHILQYGLQTLTYPLYVTRLYVKLYATCFYITVALRYTLCVSFSYNIVLCSGVLAGWLPMDCQDDRCSVMMWVPHYDETQNIQTLAFWSIFSKTTAMPRSSLCDIFRLPIGVYRFGEW